MLKAEEVNAVLLERFCQSSGSPVFKITDVGHGASITFTKNKLLITSLPLANWIAYLVQPRALRAPEVILDTEWDEKIDMWNIGCLVRFLPPLHHARSPRELDIRNGNGKTII